MRCELALAAVLLAIPVGAPAAANAPTRITFSDLCVEVESGDTAGRFVRLDPRAGDAAVTYGYTEGALMAPVSARHVRFDPATGALSFAVRTWELVRFQGRVTSWALRGRLQAGRAKRPEAVRLTRVASVDGPYQPCR